MKKKLLAGLAVGVMTLGMAGMSCATDFDFAGTMDYHNEVLLFNFTTTEASTVTLFSSSWLDGTQGFDPMLGLWDSTGALITWQDDGHITGSTLSNGVSYDHGTWDSYYDAVVGAGTYTVSLTTFYNTPNGSNLADGFAYDSQTAQPFATWDQPANGIQTGDYAFHVLNAATADQITDPVPEPTTMLLFATGLTGLVGAARRKKR